ncbi:hypothetical protein TNCV_418711 [Trichonephila clavipes]|nr:hypothetical protein TNCV_418711 [Trichonephila clavipes]
MNEFAVKDVRVNKNTVVDWYMFCREVCMVAVLNEVNHSVVKGKLLKLMRAYLSGAKSNERGTFECDKEVGGTRVRYNFGLLEGLQLPVA